MRDLRIFALLAVALLAALTLALGAGAAKASILAPFPGGAQHDPVAVG